jgi:ParB family chromosome partitioning protein
VRQLGENIQREDLNDVDRASGLLRLRDLLQDELDAAREAGIKTNIPWGTRISWAKVGQRLGLSRQRIGQLINLLDLPGEIQEDVRDGRISERDTRLYRGLKKSQQRALHKARVAGDISEKEAKQIARILKENPDQTVYQTVRLLRQPVVEPEIIPEMLPDVEETPEVWHEDPPSPHSLTPLPPEGERITNARRLSYVRQHLARIQRQGLAEGERQEILRLLRLIEQDVSSLMAALESDIF